MSVEITTERIADVEQALGCFLPEPLRDLYLAYEDTGETDGWAPLRLMPLDEVAMLHSFVEDFGWAARGLRVFWTDDNSNYAGLYVLGPLLGKVCFINHEETDLSPVYASLPSFLAVMASSQPEALDWYQFPREYPAAGPSKNPQAARQDWEIVQSFRPLYEAAEDEERTYYAFCMMALMPFEQTASLLAFTHDEYMYIQERACQILGLRRYEGAVERLAEVARAGKHNGRMAAIIALGKIGSPEAHGHLQALRTLLPEGYRAYLTGALREE